MPIATGPSHRYDFRRVEVPPIEKGSAGAWEVGFMRAMRLMIGRTCMLAAGLGVALAWTAAAQNDDSGSVATDNEKVCLELEQKYLRSDAGLEHRRIDFQLFEAAERGCSRLVADLVGAGASVQARNRFGNTAMMLAASAGHGKIVAYLVEKGSTIDQRNLAGSTALMRAVKDSRRSTAKLLLSLGADPNALTQGGLTPLEAAAFNGNTRLVKLLLNHKAAPDHVDGTGKSAILYASARGFTTIVAALLDAGVDVNGRYGHDLTALMWAAGHADDVPEAEGLETVKLLLARGAQLDMADDRGRTPLMIAAQRGHAAVITYLRSLGADMSGRDKEGKSALDLATDAATRAALTD